MKKWFFLLLGCFSLMYGQLRLFNPTKQMKSVLESTEKIEKEMDDWSKSFEENILKLPEFLEFRDDLIYTPHSFTKMISWRDVKKMLVKAESHISRMQAFLEKMRNKYDLYEQPMLAVFRYYYYRKSLEWLTTIPQLLDAIKYYQDQGIPERELFKPSKVYDYPPVPQSSIYHPPFAVRRWQAQRPMRPSVIEAEQRFSELD